MPQTRREFVHSALATSVAAALPAGAFSACSVSSNAAHTSTSTPVRSPHRTQFDAPSEIPFPRDFFWGAATSSYQIEGAWKADGKGESIWDRFAHTPGKIKNGDTGDVACDSYHRWQEDIALLRAMNLNSYRFSISWPRIQPSGAGPANSEGVDYYSRLVDALLEARIRPLVTLYHWDLPQVLEDAGGWPNRDTAARFADYAEQMGRALGDRVSDWILFNEPLAFTYQGYLEGNHAPGRKSLLGFLRAYTYREPGASCGLSIAEGQLPFRSSGHRVKHVAVRASDDSEEDRVAAERADGVTNLWFLEPALKGHYPKALAFFPDSAMGMRSIDLDKMKAPLDFIGINLYYRTIASAPTAIERLSHPQQWLFPVKMAGGEQGPKTDMGWEVWPQALYDMAMRITRDFNRPVIEITESGCGYNDGPDANGVIHDSRRIDYHRQYLQALARAMADGADVRSYHAWSLMDNFEWAEGFSQRFGLAYVDFKTQKRTMKESGRWYGKVAEENRVGSA